MSNYLQKRNGVYYFHKRVNSKLSNNRSHIIRKSLQTKCYTTGKKLASLLNYWANVYFESGIVMTSKRMDEILFEYLQSSIDEDNTYEDLRHKKNTIEKKEKVFEGSTKKALLHHLKKHNNLDKTREFSAIKEYVEREIIPISMIDNNELDELREMKNFYWKLFKYYGDILKSDLSKYENYTVEQSIEKYKKIKPKNTIINNYYEDNSSKEDIKEEDEFKVLVENYIKYLKKKKKISKETEEDYKPSFFILNEAFSKKRLSDLLVKDLEKLEYLISYLPANRFKKKMTKELNIYEQVEFMNTITQDRKNGIFKEEYEEYHIISERTQNKHFEQISNFIDYWSKKYKFDSPLDGIVLQRYKIKKDSSVERLLLSDIELSKIFSEFDYLNKKLLITLKNDPLKVYGVFLTLFLGLRPIEAGQLMVNDLHYTKDSNENIIYYLRVSKENSSDDKSLDGIKREKTDNTKRKLPLTNIFIKDLNFIEFVKQRKRDGYNFMFINETKDLDIDKAIKNTVRRCEDTFNSKLKKLEFEDLNRKSFYSLRHSFANKIKHIPLALKDKRGESLMGHTGASNSELFNRYGNKYFEPDFLYEILEKVEYKENLEFIKKTIDRLY